MINSLKIILLISILLFVINCGNPDTSKENSSKEKGTISSLVTVSAGEIYPDFGKLGIPVFFNIGTLKQKSDSRIVSKSIILGQRLQRGKGVMVKPVALFSFNQDSIKHSYLVTTYNTSENKHLGNEFNSFMSINSELQSAIENWFRAQCGFSSCNSYEWKDTYKAFLNMD